MDEALKNIENLPREENQSKRQQNSQSLSNSLVHLNIKKNISIETSPSQNNISENCQNQKLSNWKPGYLDYSSIQLFESKLKCKVNQKNANFPSAFKLINKNYIKNSKLNKVTLIQLLSFNFSVLSYSIQELIEFSALILQQNQFCKIVYPNNIIKNLVRKIAIRYNGVSYHNFSHAFYLMLLNHQCLERQTQFKKFFSQQEKFCIIIAGLSHDINHNGTNNMYQIKSQSELAKKFNNESVLQNMHVSTLWNILNQNQSLNFLNFTENASNCKKFITGLILSTDMVHHFKNLEQLQERKQSKINYQIFQDRNFMMQQLFHACDLGNSTLNFQSYISWSSLLSYEFDSQFKLEKQKGFEPTVMFEYKNISNFYKDQLWFVGKIAFPLWKQINSYFSQLSVLMQNMNKNIEKLNQKLTQEELIQRS